MSEYGAQPPHEEGYDNSTMTAEERSTLLREIRAEMREQSSCQRLREKARAVVEAFDRLSDYTANPDDFTPTIDALREELSR